MLPSMPALVAIWRTGSSRARSTMDTPVFTSPVVSLISLATALASGDSSFATLDVTFLALSTKIACLAPRLSASMPICPLPANRSRKTLPSVWNWMMEKTASLILSAVGLTSSPSRVSSRLPRAEPVITRIIYPHYFIQYSIQRIFLQGYFFDILTFFGLNRGFFSLVGVKIPKNRPRAVLRHLGRRLQLRLIRL